MDSRIEGNEILKVLETVYLPSWGTTALILEGGEIRVWLESQPSRPKTRQMFINDVPESCRGSSFFNSRIKLFDDLHKYYLRNYESNYCNK